MAEKRITFSGVDAGVSDMMRKLRSSSQDLGREMMQQARQYSQSGKEQVSFIEQQIKAIERRNQLERQGREQVARQQLQETGDRGGFQKAMGKIQVESDQDDMQVKLLREVIETIRMTSREEISEDKKQVQQRIQEQRRGPLGAMLFGKQQLSPEDMLKTALQEEELSSKGRVPGRQGGTSAGTILGSILGAQLITDTFAAVKQMPSVRSELDTLVPSVSLAGTGAGGVIGAGVGAIAGSVSLTPDPGGGALKGFEAGSIIGRQIGEFIGQSAVRTLQERNNIQQNRNAILALSGIAPNIGDLSNYGLSQSESLGLANTLARSRGSFVGSDARRAVLLQRGLGIDTSMTSQLLGTSPFATDPLSGFATMFSGGGFGSGDRSALPIAVSNLTQLVREFSNTTEMVNSNMTAQTMAMFSEVGGGFSIRDPRSIQRISQINRSLANPQNDIMQAENFAILRRLNPQAGIFDIKQMQEQGLQTPGFFREKLRNISNRFAGDDQFAMMALQQQTGLSFSATRGLFQNRQSILSGQMGEAETADFIDKLLKDTASQQTTSIEKSTAKISDSFAESMQEGIKTVAEYMTKSFGDAIDAAIKRQATSTIDVKVSK